MTSLGIDLGTGSVKAALLDDDGLLVAKASQAYGVAAPQPGWAESDPWKWLAATQAVVTRACASAGRAPDSVGFSGQMHGVVVTDGSFTPLRPAILWADGRSVQHARELAEVVAPAGLSRLGSAAVTGFAATTLAWLLANEPQVMDATVHVLQPKDWLRVALGGDVATDPSDASGTLLFDVVSGQWSTRVVKWLGLDPALLPGVRASQELAGSIRLDCLPRELPCVVGAADTACAVVGLGLPVDGGFVAVGSGAQVVRMMATPQIDESLRTHTFARAGAVGDGWYRIGAVQSSGLTLTKALEWLGATTQEAAAALSEGVLPSDPIFVPYLAGERTPFMDPALRGSWHGLTLATDRAAMLRSVLEGVAQAVALGVEAVQASGERLPEVVPLIGGGTHDPAFRQLLADATGLALAVTDAPDAAVVGAALLACGVTSSPRGVVSDEIVRPSPDAGDLLRTRRAIMVQHALVKETP